MQTIEGLTHWLGNSIEQLGPRTPLVIGGFWAEAFVLTGDTDNQLVCIVVPFTKAEIKSVYGCLIEAAKGGDDVKAGRV